MDVPPVCLEVCADIRGGAIPPGPTIASGNVPLVVGVRIRWPGLPRHVKVPLKVYMRRWQDTTKLKGRAPGICTLELMRGIDRTMAPTSYRA